MYVPLDPGVCPTVFTAIEPGTTMPPHTLTFTHSQQHALAIALAVTLAIGCAPMFALKSGITEIASEMLVKEIHKPHQGLWQSVRDRFNSKGNSGSPESLSDRTLTSAYVLCPLLEHALVFRSGVEKSNKKRSEYIRAKVQSGVSRSLHMMEQNSISNRVTTDEQGIGNQNGTGERDARAAPQEVGDQSGAHSLAQERRNL
ncbi:hypothetical protein OG21DRAFT_1525081 [Imleria badia]|nr:hypothetical protein OG21DRAFT_1525081 [Imleria badia]